MKCHKRRRFTLDVEFSAGKIRLQIKKPPMSESAEAQIQQLRHWTRIELTMRWTVCTQTLKSWFCYFMFVSETQGFLVVLIVHHINKVSLRYRSHSSFEAQSDKLTVSVAKTPSFHLDSCWCDGPLSGLGQFGSLLDQTGRERGEKGIRYGTYSPCRCPHLLLSRFLGNYSSD